MKTRITKAELAQLIKNEVRKIVGEDSLMSPPELGEPNYLSIDGPAVPADMGDYYDDEEYMDDEPDMSAPCPSGIHTLSEGCGCGSKKAPEHEMDGLVSDILANPKPCMGCGKIHSGPCGQKDSHHSASYMAKPQLSKISRYAAKLSSMIDEGEQIQDWQESKIAQMAQMIGDVYHSIEYKKNKGEF